MRFFKRYAELKMVIVSARNGGVTFRGVLWQNTGEWLVLKGAEKLEQTGEVLAVDGEVLVPLREVDYVQVLN